MMHRHNWVLGVAVAGLTALVSSAAWAQSPVKVIVVFNTDVDVSVINDVGGQVDIVISGVKAVGATLPSSAIAKIKAHASVAFIEPDVEVTIPEGSAMGGISGKPGGGDTTPPSQSLPTGIDRINADLSTAAAGDGSGTVNVDIAVIDTGIDLKHSDLSVHRNVSFVIGAKTGNDDNGHGTHVAGTAAALDNTIGVVGVAPGARLWAVKVLDRNGSGWLSGVVAGVDYVTQNAAEIEVANMSLGFEGTSATFDAAIASSVAAGVTYAVAAGNSAKDSATFSPANHPDVITVSAIADSDGKSGALGAPTSYGADDSFATFSNFGQSVEIAAPGVNINSTYKGNTYSKLSGTSMASPHAAGTAALYKSNPVNAAATPAQVLNALVTAGFAQSGPDGFTGDPDASPEPLDNTGGF